MKNAKTKTQSVDISAGDALFRVSASKLSEKGFYNVGTGVPVTLEKQIKTIIDVFSPKENPSPIVYLPDKPVGGGCLMDISNAKEELGYEPQYDVKALFEAYKEEMKVNRFLELRGTT